MNPVAFTIFSIDVKWYSVFILVGIIIAWILIRSEARKFNISSDFITNLLFWTIIMGIIGARLYYIIFNWSYYSNHLNEIYRIWEGGLAIHGGIILGGLTLIMYCRKYKVSTFRMLDICAPYLLFAQALGRWGNFFNSEAYGAATTLEHLKSIKIIPEFVIYGMNINGTYYTPAFYYESLWCLLGVVLILIIRKFKYTRLGWQVGFYLMWYGLGRFFIESSRTDSLMLGYIKVAQLVSIILFVVGLIIILIQARKPKLEDMYNINKDNVEVVSF